MSLLLRKPWLLFLLAAGSSGVTLTYYYVGEEAILTLSSLEMWLRRDLATLWMYGVDAKHGVFANWLIVPFGVMLGWEYALGGARAVMILATVATGLTVYGFMRRVGRDAGEAALAAAIYMTFADILLYRGWLAYRDPLYGYLVFSAIAALWLGAREAAAKWLLVAGIFAFAAYLTKGLTAYVFLGSAGIVLLADRQSRAGLLRPRALAAVAVGLALPLAWLFLVQAGSAQAARYTTEIGAKLIPPGIAEWVLKLVSYPVEVMVRLLPASGIAIYFLAKSHAIRAGTRGDAIAMAAAAIAFLCFLPYWLAPHSHFRYLLPLVPLAAIAFAAVIARGGEQARSACYSAMWVAVAIKLIFVSAFPVYQNYYRGANYKAAARDILARVDAQPLYTTNVSASGLSVSAYINELRGARTFLTFPPLEWSSGFVITYEPNPALGQVTATYTLGGNELYLLCRGAACGAAVPER